MPPILTTGQVLGLAPDASSAKSGKGLATPRCSCPSRKFPCKHCLGLLLLLADQPAAAPQATPPAWVEEWLSPRVKSAERREQRRQAEDTSPGAAQARRATAKAKSAAAREAKVSAGMQELASWLRDQLREGLASAPQRAPAAFDRMAARMVDAQAPGAARLLRSLGGTPASGEGWQGRLLEQLARLYLLAEGYAHIEALTPYEQANLRSAIGFTQGQEELLHGAGSRDRWLILGRRVEEEERLRVQRTWLWGASRTTPALIFDFSAAGQPIDRSIIPGGQIDAALGAYAAALAGNPWLERYPLCLGPITLAQPDDAWIVCDEAGRALPLAPPFGRDWKLVARSGGRPFTLCGQWDGESLTPLSAWVGGFIDLGGPPAEPWASCWPPAGPARRPGGSARSWS